MRTEQLSSALIVDDEPPMRDQLRARLHEVWPELNIIAEAGNGVAAVELTALHHPQIIFLDIRMPGQSGIEAARQLLGQVHIVFVTAYDEYAVQAFEQGAVDYLLKPVDPDRLRATCERLRQRIALPLKLSGAAAQSTPQNEQIMQLLSQLSQRQQPKREYLRWIQASVGSSLRMISTREILFFQSDEKYTRVQTDSTEVLIRKTLKELEDELDPAEFWRIHRSTLVRVDAITEVTRDFRGRQLVQLKNHPEKLEVSRNHAHLFQQM
ncbi:LytTR family DNA-binding domain-containing protein [Undibacterium sp. Jales W-56]|uniref:LytR/AlgR family response regulator transcription factor n=1 Tax=Undibacterium sp. Jales W-56 TaxID=2897325 RepID=UPI0021D30F7C|nr:LytTR family DNA-binding domain-containing protein [Undibacterium sp. Jales W-56]MCU6434171.1 LytTR family DNA-binding domain-containing protein [Undibacterium sp. Jales W-56]